MTQDNATLIERIELDPTLVIFRIRPDVIPPAGEPWFLPGQYVTIGTAEIQRAYSIASEPGERRWMEFYIRFAREPATVSPLTHMLWTKPVGSRLHVGDKIAGRFTLERTVAAGDTRVKVLVAAGTGLAPFVSMVRRLLVVCEPKSTEALKSKRNQALISRSSVNWRTCGTCRRAVTFQSIWRTSSCSWYSRRSARSSPAPRNRVR